MAFRPILVCVRVTLVFALCLIAPSLSVRAAVDGDALPFGVRFEVPKSYCEIENSSPAEIAFKTRVRQRDEVNTLVASLFADCEQKRTWNGDPTKQPTRFGAVFLHRVEGSFRAITVPRAAYLSRMASQLNSDEASFKYTVEQIAKGALDAKVESARVLAATPNAIFIGFTAVITHEGRGERMLTGISAYTLINGLQVTLHLYQTRDGDEATDAMLPEATAIMQHWIELNGDAGQNAPPPTPSANIDPRVSVDIPLGYCEILETSPREQNLLARTRREREPNMVLLALFADCEELATWRNDNAARLNHFGAAFILKVSGNVRPIKGDRPDYLTQLNRILSSATSDGAKRLLDRIVSGPVDMKPKRPQVVATNSSGIYIGQIAEMTSDQSTTTLAGMSAITLINQYPVTVHFYRTHQDERSVRSLLPLAMSTLIGWTLRNEGDERTTTVASQRGKTDPVKIDEKLNQPAVQPAPESPAMPTEPELTLVNSAVNAQRIKNLTLLTTRAFDELSRKIEAEQAAFDRSEMPEGLLINSYFAFGSADPDLAQHLDAWIKRQPQSFAPYLARGIYYWHLGFSARGELASSVTPGDRFALMNHFLEASVRDIKAALAIRANLGIAWAALINIATATGQTAGDIYSEAIEAAPSSLYLRSSYAFSFHPDWGGGLSAAAWRKNTPHAKLVTVMERNRRWYKFYIDLQTDAATIPALRPVIESPNYEAARQAFARLDYPAAMLKLIAALELDQEAAKHVFDGNQYSTQGEYEAAIKEFDQATRPGSEWMSTLRSRALALRNHGYKTHSFAAYRMAMEDYQAALTLDPYNPDLLTDAVVVVREFPVRFPERAAEFEKLWRLPATCKSGRENLRPLKLNRAPMPGPEMIKSFCAVENLLDKALVFGSSDPNVRDMRGVLYLFALRLPELAAEEFAKAIEIHDSHAKSWENYATSLHELGDCRAVAAYRKYIELCANGSCDETAVSIVRSRIADLSFTSTCDK